MTEQRKIVADPQSVGSVKLKKIGNSTGFLLPKEMMARLNISTGDTFYATLTPEGGNPLHHTRIRVEEPWSGAGDGVP